MKQKKPFTESCYKLLKKIPKGKITTYKILANTLQTRAYRAVGNIMNKNPFPIEVPCHRVVKTNSEVGGYVHGTKKKIKLLKEEGITIKNKKIQNINKHLYRFKRH
jgi:methylated-DNA-[protein]-cysteine S-methyltransferase